MNSYTNTIKKELMQLKDYNKITEIKDKELNGSVLLEELEISSELITAIKSKWNSAKIFKREKNGVIEDSYCTCNYVLDVIIRYCQHRTMFKERFDI